jgi:cytochrome c oxidase subunit I
MQSQSQATSHSHEAEHHHEPGFWGKYIFSTDHKVIGIQYGVTAMMFLFFGLCLMGLMRYQLAYPGHAVPGIGKFLLKVHGPDLIGKDAQGNVGVIMPTLYNSYGAMHGTIMVFLAIVPLAFGAFGNFVTPLQIGAPDMTFPRVNMVSYQFYFMGGVIMCASFFIPGGAAQSGWTSYSPLATVADMAHRPDGQTFWIIGMVCLINSSLLGAVNFITTIIQLRANGLSWMRMPFFVWAQFVTAFLLLLAFPPLEAAAVLQLMDNALGTSFFLPTGLMVSGNPLHVSGGGSPLLWQHLFWFLGHPEVYVLILPAMGIVTEIIANNTRKPIWGYRSMVYSILVIGFLSFIVWAHHMYLTGMGTRIATFFQTTTMMISIPSVIILSSLFISLWGASMRFTTPMCFALGFLPMFGIGGLTGLPLGFNVSDIFLHDTYYVIAHFHYIVAPGTIFGLFAGIYYWYPKATGRFMNEFWGKVHFGLSFIFMNMIFLPMFVQGFEGMSRRMYDGGLNYKATTGVLGLSDRVIHMNVGISHAVWALGLTQFIFIINFFWSVRNGKKVGSDNPWDATTLEWQTPTPPPHGNFDKPLQVFRGPYEYSVPGRALDFTTQNDPAQSEPLTHGNPVRS